MERGRGLVIAAPHSGAGKTCLTMGLLRALSRRQIVIRSAKIGPDYIDPQFHQIASGQPSINIDGWAMREAGLKALADQLMAEAELTIFEGVMGLHDGAVKPGVSGHGATADVAKALGLPVVLVVDCAGMGRSVAALVKGFQIYDETIQLAGVILNKLGSPAHFNMMKTALDDIGVPVYGAVPRHHDMSLPARHLGLVQASEIEGVERQIEGIADLLEEHLSLDKLIEAALPIKAGCQQPMALSRQAPMSPTDLPGILPLGQNIAVARDDAFRFFYPHIEQAWQAMGISVCYFSPLEDEAPPPDADAVFLPGGYPELHAERLAGNLVFLGGLRAAAAGNKTIYGECGGYMVLGEGLIDKAGVCHKMSGLLQLTTSFEVRKLHLGYRHVRGFEGGAVESGVGGSVFRGHEFHYSSVVEEVGDPLFVDADGERRYGLQLGRVFGSFVHLIDRAV